MYKILNKALEFAVNAHSGQYDKAGFPYILHPIRVLETVEPVTELPGSRAFDIKATKIVAVLHDVVEDTSITLEDIEREFGSYISCEVDAVTKRKNEPYRKYLDRIRDRYECGGPAMAVKLADMEDNSRPERLSYLSIEKQLRLAAKYARGRHYLLTGEWYENENLEKLIKAGFRR
jgi:(p)ppGpp synthase/HD superfamily hydrolase